MSPGSFSTAGIHSTSDRTFPETRQSGGRKITRNSARFDNKSSALVTKLAYFSAPPYLSWVATLVEIPLDELHAERRDDRKVSTQPRRGRGPEKRAENVPNAPRRCAFIGRRSVVNLMRRGRERGRHLFWHVGGNRRSWCLPRRGRVVVEVFFSVCVAVHVAFVFGLKWEEGYIGGCMSTTFHFPGNLLESIMSSDGPFDGINLRHD